MPRASTQTSETNRWIRKNKHWLSDDTAPMVQQLKALAKTIDTELADNGAIKAATASAYRATYLTLLELRPNSQKIADQLDREDDSLMKPTKWGV
ncbi:hypothetical protein [Propionimicrobium lymphophilum]|uniref:hypothetical protein n=1 Tax=Propionimicrobium lymphophilum TaxID=33012 RepID=UPI0023F53AAF|nr:hypothetical protein [Propionimicrobium lymphophilum]